MRHKFALEELFSAVRKKPDTQIVEMISREVEDTVWIKASIQVRDVVDACSILVDLEKSKYIAVEEFEILGKEGYDKVTLIVSFYLALKVIKREED